MQSNIIRNGYVKSSEMVKIWKAAEHKSHGDSDNVRKKGWGKGKDE